MLLEKNNTCLVVFNMQLELIPILMNGTQLLNDCRWLVDVAKSFDLSTIIIEHKKLGASSETLKEVAEKATYFEKTYFDFSKHENIRDQILNSGCTQFVLAGAETHVCLLQSALGLQKMGKEVYVLEDTCSARNKKDHKLGLKRMEKEGVHLITKEMLFFESIRHSEYPNYIDLAMKFLDGRYIK